MWHVRATKGTRETSNLKSEKDRVIYHKGDILLTVNGEDIGGRTLDEVTDWIRTFTEETITMTFLNRTHFNDLSHKYKSVRKG